MAPRKTKLKLGKPRKYWEYAHLDIDKQKLQRYYMPVALQQTKHFIKTGQLDKKTLQIPQQQNFVMNYFFRDRPKESSQYVLGQGQYDSEYHNYQYRVEDVDNQPDYDI